MFKSNSADVFNMSEIVVQVRQGHLLTNYDFEINLDFTLLNIPDRDVFNNVFLLMDAGYQIFGNDSNLLIVFYVQIMPDDLVMQLHRF